jgi:nitrous oxidase accessory protein NosD
MVENSPRTQIRANHVRVTDPSSWPCGYDSGVAMYRSPGSVIAWNRFIDFQDRGIWAYQSNRVRIRGNTFFYGHDGFTLNFDYACGICILDASHIVVRGNVIESGPSAGTTAPTMEFGIYADGDHLTVLRNRIRKTLYGAELHVSDSEIEGNTIRRSSGVGFTMGSYLGNQVRDNDFRSGGTLDCLDHSSGFGTAGTGNLWLRNLGRLADPDGICGSP